jgi:hypothetical protein
MRGFEMGNPKDVLQERGGTDNEQIFIHTKEGNDGNFKWEP